MGKKARGREKARAQSFWTWLLVFQARRILDLVRNKNDTPAAQNSIDRRSACVYTYIHFVAALQSKDQSNLVTANKEGEEPRRDYCLHINSDVTAGRSLRARAFIYTYTYMGLRKWREPYAGYNQQHASCSSLAAARATLWYQRYLHRVSSSWRGGILLPKNLFSKAATAAARACERRAVQRAPQSRADSRHGWTADWEQRVSLSHSPLAPEVVRAHQAKIECACVCVCVYIYI